MKTGDIITLSYGGLPIEVIIIDDCYRIDGDRCTALVKINHSPYTEFEINLQENNSGKDIQRSAGLGTQARR
jgi:hypothetical protein